MIWPNGAGSAFALGFDMDGDTIWKNKIRTLVVFCYDLFLKSKIVV